MFEVDGISSETLEKAKQCKTADELAELAKSEGIDLDDEMLEGVAGGAVDGWRTCNPNCSCNEECMMDRSRCSVL